MRSSINTITIIVTAFITLTLPAQQHPEDVAKQLSNPISSLISAPLQNNMDVGIGDNNGWRNTLNFQPVIPIKLTNKVNLITRWVQPIIFQQDVIDGQGYQSGLGDAVASAFFSPSTSPNGFTWGAGPVFLVPVATTDLLASKKFGVGPTVVALKQIKGWTIGALMNQIWSVAGSDDRPAVNQLFIQPFIVHNWKSGAGVSLNAEYTQNWEGNTATIFIIPMITGVTKLGKQTVQLAIGPRFAAAAPTANQPDFGVRSALIFVFPK